MRKYIRNEELTSTLQQILSRKDPELLSVYREVILYWTDRENHRSRHLETMLFWPTRTVLAFFNLILLPVTCTVFVLSMYYWLPEIVSVPVVFALLCLTVFEAYRFSKLASNFHKCRPYLIIDELLARRILVVQQTARPKPAKAAK